MYKTVFFDLDGTLTDPKEGITKCVSYALGFFGIHENNLDNLTGYIGPPLIDGFSEIAGLSEKDAIKAVERYRERYGKTGIFENRLYDGTTNMLENLRKNGVRMCIASSKPEVFVKRISEKYKISEYFEHQTGSELDGRRNDKAEVIAETLKRCGITDLSEVIMVGDRRHDIEGAKKCGIKSAGVTFGYGSEEELRSSGADHIANSFDELEKIILEK
ncbi:MAG: HAD-IB family phosphatase [Oscillospiraceae bacterium]|nr:HAD-IB family phosphatase [Oscillospiraceae bacterium]